MKFLANENLPYPSVKVIRENGFDIVSIREDFPSISDEEVLRIAKESNRIILTFDSDYGELIFKYSIKNPPSVIYFRNKGNNPIWAGNLIIELLNEDKYKFEKCFTVVGENSVRQRIY